MVFRGIGRGFLAALALCSTAIGCAPQNWVPGPTASAADLVPAQARCRIMARHGGSGFEASGSTRFVAAAAVGYAIGNAIRTSADYSDCMEASGFLPAPKGTPVAVAQAAPAANPPAASSVAPQSVGVQPAMAMAPGPMPPYADPGMAAAPVTPAVAVAPGAWSESPSP